MAYTETGTYWHAHVNGFSVEALPCGDYYVRCLRSDRAGLFEKDGRPRGGSLTSDPAARCALDAFVRARGRVAA